jgi:hypothetical protein
LFYLFILAQVPEAVRRELLHIALLKGAAANQDEPSYDRGIPRSDQESKPGSPGVADERNRKGAVSPKGRFDG